MASLLPPPKTIFFLCVVVTVIVSASANPIPTPTPWPHQFHSILILNSSHQLQVIDLWYDWPNGRNFNIIQDQLSGYLLYDLEWNNGTSYFYTLDSQHQCRITHPGVGILRPNWLDGANYLGQRLFDGFLCNVWEKADFLTYYEDILTRRPVHWLFYTGRGVHVMTFEVGAALEDEKWQVPAYCFIDENSSTGVNPIITHSQFIHGDGDGVLRGSMPLNM